MNDLIISFQNTYATPPQTLDNAVLEKNINLNFLKLKLLKVTLLGIAPFTETITRKNIAKVTVITQCDCGAYCKFNFKWLVSPEALPACGRCNTELDKLIQYHYQHHQIKLTRKEAWHKLGYQIDPKSHSAIFWYLLNKTNHHQIRLGKAFKSFTQQELDALAVPKYMYLSRACTTAPLQPDLLDPNIAYQCLCGAFCYFKVSELQNFEPLGMCSVCTDELCFSFQDMNIHPFLKQLRFKHLWKQLLHSFNHPYVEFRYVWQDYLKARKQVRKNAIELHFREYIPKYYQRNRQIS